MYTVQGMVYTVHCTVYTVYYTVHTLYILNSIHLPPELYIIGYILVNI